MARRHLELVRQNILEDQAVRDFRQVKGVLAAAAREAHMEMAQMVRMLQQVKVVVVLEVVVAVAALLVALIRPEVMVAPAVTIHPVRARVLPALAVYMAGMAQMVAEPVGEVAEPCRSVLSVAAAPAVQESNGTRRMVRAVAVAVRVVNLQERRYRSSAATPVCMALAAAAADTTMEMHQVQTAVLEHRGL